MRRGRIQVCKITSWHFNEKNQGVRCLSTENRNFASIAKSIPNFVFLITSLMLWNNIMSYYFAEGDIYIIMQAWQLFYLINAHVKRLFNQHSLRKQTTFHGATTGFHVKLWCLRNKCRNSILMMHHYQDLGSASDWSCYMGNLLQPITSTTQIWVVMHHQYGISVLVS